VVTLSRLNGSVVAINPDLITWIDVTPDTIVSLLGGDKIIVREPLDEVIARIVAFRRNVGSANATGKEGAVAYLANHRAEAAHSGRHPTGRPTPMPPRGSAPPGGGT
jgi:flagellar protein FlbD